VLHGEVLDGDSDELVLSEQEAVVGVLVVSEVDGVFAAKKGPVVDHVLPVKMRGEDNDPRPLRHVEDGERRVTSLLLKGTADEVGRRSGRRVDEGVGEVVEVLHGDEQHEHVDAVRARGRGASDMETGTSSESVESPDSNSTSSGSSSSSLSLGTMEGSATIPVAPPTSSVAEASAAASGGPVEEGAAAKEEAMSAEEDAELLETGASGMKISSSMARTGAAAAAGPGMHLQFLIC
jgi:hypothetical protein